jgi:hypothetical protein
MGRARIIADLVGFSTDSGVINFGADKEITLTHDPDDGLILKHAATADDSFPELTFQTGDTDIAVNDLLGRINFQAPDEGAGTDAILVAGAIAAISEGDFSSSANATSLIFQTGASETATTKMTLSSGGNLDVTGDITGSTLNADGDTAAGDAAAIGYTAAEGLILTGQGSTNDVTIKNDADADVIEIPTGTVNVTMAGTLDVTGDITGSTLNADGDTAAGDNAAIGFTSTEGLILTGQGSTNDVTIKNDADGTVAVIPTGTTNFGFDSGFGSADVAYGVRAWVNFNGVGVVAIRDSGNVSSITDHGTGQYTVNFTTNMPDVNYCVNVTGSVQGTATNNGGFNTGLSRDSTPTVGSVRFECYFISGFADTLQANVSVIR